MLLASSMVASDSDSDLSSLEHSQKDDIYSRVNRRPTPHKKKHKPQRYVEYKRSSSVQPLPSQNTDVQTTTVQKCKSVCPSFLYLTGNEAIYTRCINSHFMLAV